MTATPHTPGSGTQGHPHRIRNSCGSAQVKDFLPLLEQIAKRGVPLLVGTFSRASDLNRRCLWGIPDLT